MNMTLHGGHWSCFYPLFNSWFICDSFNQRLNLGVVRVVDLHISEGWKAEEIHHMEVGP